MVCWVRIYSGNYSIRNMSIIRNRQINSNNSTHLVGRKGAIILGSLYIPRIYSSWIFRNSICYGSPYDYRLDLYDNLLALSRSQKNGELLVQLDIGKQLYLRMELLFYFLKSLFFKNLFFKFVRLEFAAKPRQQKLRFATGQGKT